MRHTMTVITVITANDNLGGPLEVDNALEWVMPVDRTPLNEAGEFESW